MQQKKFVTNLGLLLFLNLLIKPFWVVVIDVAVQQKVGLKDYGMYYTMLSFSFLFNIVLDLGLTNFNNKNIAQNSHLFSKHFSHLAVLKFSLAILYMVVTIGIGWLNGYDYRYIKVLVLLGFNQILISFIMYLRSNLSGLHLFKTDSVISVLDRTLMIIACSLLLWTDSFGGAFDIMWYIYTQTFAYALTAIITFIAVINKTHSFKLSWNSAFFLMMLKKSFPYAVLILLMTFYNYIGSVMMERILRDKGGDEQCGIYAQAYRFLDAANMISFLFAGMLLPIFSRMIKYKESVEALVKLVVTLLLTPALIVLAGCWFYSEELMLFIYKHNVKPETPLVFSLLMSCFVATSMSYIFGTLLTASGNLKQLHIISALGIVINISLNLILIPLYQSVGACTASLITQFFTSLLQIIVVQYLFKFKVNNRLLSTIIIFSLGVLAISYLSRTLTGNWMMNFGIMIAGSILWAFLTRIINLKGMYRLMKYS